jgi:hypothetical protein
MKRLNLVLAAAYAVALAGCSSTPTYKYEARPAETQKILPTAGQEARPRIASIQKLTLITAEPRNVGCDDEKEFAFNVAIANKETRPFDVAPTNFEVDYAGRSFPAVDEKEVQKEISSEQWGKDVFAGLSVVTGVLQAATGNMAAGQATMTQGYQGYQMMDAADASELDKYRNKVLAPGSIAPKSTYGGLVVAKLDAAGSGYHFDSAHAPAEIVLVANIDGETHRLKFACTHAQ